MNEKCFSVRAKWMNQYDSQMYFNIFHFHRYGHTPHYLAFFLSIFFQSRKLRKKRLEMFFCFLNKLEWHFKFRWRFSQLYFRFRRTRKWRNKCWNIRCIKRHTGNVCNVQWKLLSNFGFSYLFITSDSFEKQSICLFWICEWSNKLIRSKYK